MLLVILTLLLIIIECDNNNNNNNNNNNLIIDDLIVPNIVHQVYDYNTPSFFLYLSLQCVQTYIQPYNHILWVNDEGRFRKNQFIGFIEKNDYPIDSWERNFTKLFIDNKIEYKFITFPINPPGNNITTARNAAHRSDFVRMKVLSEMGGIYIDTDAFPIRSITSLRVHEFTLAYDNIIDDTKPKRLNNGVILSIPNAEFLKVWSSTYHSFDPQSFDHHSSIVPFKLAMEYPDLINVEMSRISPISYAFHTSVLAIALTCGIYVPSEGILHPIWSVSKRVYTFENVLPDKYMYKKLINKYILHLTMSQVRGVCMMRKHLSSIPDLNLMPSFLGSIFRKAVFGIDNFDYNKLINGSNEEKMNSWNQCRTNMGIFSVPDINAEKIQLMQSTGIKSTERQGYVQDLSSIYGI